MASSLSGLRSGLGKRGLGLGASPPSYESSSDEQALLGLGESRGSSIAKRRRGGRRLPAAPPAHAACQNPLNAQLCDNPLFEDEDFTSAAAAGTDDEEPYWLRGMPVSSGSYGGGKENTPLLPKGGAGSQDCFAAPTCPLAAFLTELSSTSVLCALTALEMKGLHPVGDDCFATLDVTIAGMLVLCRRASYEAEEMSPQLLLTCLWLLMSTCSQYRTSLSYNANLFLHLHPEGAAMLDGLKADMVELQQQVLRRASWRVLLRDPHDVHAALNDLLACPDYEAVAVYVESCAERGVTPEGTHDHSCHTLAAGAAACMAGWAPGRAPPAAPRVRSGGSSLSSGSGLDGSYGQTTAPGNLRGNIRRAMAPRNC